MQRGQVTKILVRSGPVGLASECSPLLPVEKGLLSESGNGTKNGDRNSDAASQAASTHRVMRIASET
jgi:hypothetical protein